MAEEKNFMGQLYQISHTIIFHNCNLCLAQLAKGKAFNNNFCR